MKKSIKLILIFTLGTIFGVTLLITYASTYSSEEITYDNSKSGSSKTNVKDAVDDLYSIANKRFNIRVASNKRCIRAINLHSQGGKTFGSLGTSGTLTSGDAFDCDVNNDGIYDGEKERFYYITDLNSNTAVLLYYINTSNGVATLRKRVAYNLNNVNNAGPVTAISDLPSTSQWVTTIYSNPRQITNQSGGTTTPAGTIVKFNYEGLAARLLTAQEINAACKITVGNYNTGELDTCTYFMENTYYTDSSLSYGYWLETPNSSYHGSVWYMNGYGHRVNFNDANNMDIADVRPVIEVLKSDIAY